jgi:hypothetical protein
MQRAVVAEKSGSFGSVLCSRRPSNIASRQGVFAQGGCQLLEAITVPSPLMTAAPMFKSCARRRTSGCSVSVSRADWTETSMCFIVAPWRLRVMLLLLIGKLSVLYTIFHNRGGRGKHEMHTSCAIRGKPGAWIDRGWCRGWEEHVLSTLQIQKGCL